MAAKTALIDSGATENFLNHKTTERLGITPKKLSVPQVMNNVNKTTNQSGLMQHYYNF